MQTTNTRNYQLQGSYTRYMDGLHTGFDSNEGPSKRRNYSTLDRAIKAAKKELRENELPKVMRFEREVYGPGRLDFTTHLYGEDGQELHGSARDYGFWHVDALRIVDRETQQVLWEYVVEPEEDADEEPEEAQGEQEDGTSEAATAITYEEALRHALDAYREFHEALGRIDGAKDDDSREFWGAEATRRAAETCGQQDMLRWIYGVGEEQVHDDLAALMAQR